METIKNIDENIGRTLQDFNLKLIFNDLMPLAKSTK